MLAAARTAPVPWSPPSPVGRSTRAWCRPPARCAATRRRQRTPPPPTPSPGCRSRVGPGEPASPSRRRSSEPSTPPSQARRSAAAHSSSQAQRAPQGPSGGTRWVLAGLAAAVDVLEVKGLHRGQTPRVPSEQQVRDQARVVRRAAPRAHGQRLDAVGGPPGMLPRCRPSNGKQLKTQLAAGRWRVFPDPPPSTPPGPRWPAADPCEPQGPGPVTAMRAGQGVADRRDAHAVHPGAARAHKDVKLPADPAQHGRLHDAAKPAMAAGPRWRTGAGLRPDNAGQHVRRE